MKLKKLNLKSSSAVQLNEGEMKMVIGGLSATQDVPCNPSACHGVCYEGRYQGTCGEDFVGGIYVCTCHHDGH